MSRAELDGYINAMARLNGRKAPSAGDAKTSRKVKSLRQKRPIKKRRT
ncbi:hypothetical protein [Pectobacterium sp. A5351]|nr:hypothetical protein [Pectobacterium sp. A5351]WCG83814.1 hypothetical protein O1Q74_03695 [Pectobacterium sp. A5351]